LKRLDINQSTFYNWLGCYRCGGYEALSDRCPGPNQAWNRLPETNPTAVVDLALAEPELSPRELAVKYTDETAYFVSESTVYRLLKAQDLMTNPAYRLMQASDKCQQPTTRGSSWPGACGPHDVGP
jgi:transposase